MRPGFVVSWLATVSVFGLAQIAVAADGVLEINQVCASGDGCFSGDAPGFPVEILNSGSYVLTGNLDVPVLTHGITTFTSVASLPTEISLSLDLNGFTIRSTTSCSGDPLVCSPTSTTDALAVFVAVQASGSATARIHGGQVQGMATGGVACQPGEGSCIVENLSAAENGYVGVAVDGIIRNVSATRNGDTGISVSNHGVIQGCYAGNNGGTGIFGKGTVESNVAEKNADFGIQAFSATVRGNRVTESDVGLSCSTCSAQDNVVLSTTTAAIDFNNSTSAYGANTLSSSGSSIVNAGNAVASAPNACSPACP